MSRQLTTHSPMSAQATARLPSRFPSRAGLRRRGPRGWLRRLGADRVECAGERRRGKAVPALQKAHVAVASDWRGRCRSPCLRQRRRGWRSPSRSRGGTRWPCLGGVESGERSIGCGAESPWASSAHASTARISGSSLSTPSSLASRSACVPKSMAASRSPSVSARPAVVESSTTPRFASPRCASAGLRRCRRGTARRHRPANKPSPPSASRVPAARPTHPGGKVRWHGPRTRPWPGRHVRPGCCPSHRR